MKDPVTGVEYEENSLLDYFLRRDPDFLKHWRAAFWKMAQLHAVRRQFVLQLRGRMVQKAMGFGRNWHVLRSDMVVLFPMKPMRLVNVGAVEKEKSS
jgi:hypothetical protein